MTNIALKPEASPEVSRESSVEDRCKNLIISIPSIRDTLKPENSLENIGLSYLKSIMEQIQEHIGFIGPVVIEAKPAMTTEEIEYLNKAFKSISTVYEALTDALNWLRVAYEALETIENQKGKSHKFATAFKFEYYKCLGNCCEALTVAISNFETIDK